ncbi:MULTISPECIES: helix-turn-helix transcriptional regulator [unclassified Kocuria]
MGGLVQDHRFFTACTPCADAAGEVEEAPSMTIAARHQACRYTSTARSATEHRSGETSTELAARLLAEAPQRDWRLRDLAALVHLSVSQLGRAFTQRFGMPPMRYLAHIRAHRLAELLVETDLPIGVATTKVGWRSRGHAARQFTDVVGISPSEYRRTAIGRTLTETSPWPSATQGSPESEGPLTTGVP